MELHWITEIQDSTARKVVVATVMTVRAISYLLRCLLLNSCVDVLLICVLVLLCFFIFCAVFLYCFVYVYLFLFLLSVRV